MVRLQDLMIHHFYGYFKGKPRLEWLSSEVSARRLLKKQNKISLDCKIKRDDLASYSRTWPTCRWSRGIGVRGQQTLSTNLNNFVIGSCETNKVHCFAQGLFFISNFTKMKYLSISCNVLNVYYSRMIKLFSISSRSSESLQTVRIYYVWIV